MSLRSSTLKLAKKQITHLISELDPAISNRDVPAQAFALFELFKIFITTTQFKMVETDSNWIEPIPDMSRSGRDTKQDDPLVSHFNEEDGLPRIAQLLATSEDDIIRNNVAAVISVLTKSMQKLGNKVALAHNGGVGHLIRFLSTIEHAGIRFWSAVALRNLGRNDATKTILAASGAIPILVKLLSSSNENVQAAALCCLVNVSNNDENERRIAEEGAIPIIVRLMKSSNDIVVNNAIWALNNLSFKDENKIAVAKEGGIPTLVHHILHSSSEETQEYSAYVIWNLTFKNDMNKVLICEAGGIQALSQLLATGKTTLQKSGLGALNNITSKTAIVPLDTIERELSVGYLVSLVHSDLDHEIARHTNSIFKNLLMVDRSCKWFVLNDAVPMLIIQAQRDRARLASRPSDCTVPKEVPALTMLKEIGNRLAKFDVTVPPATGAPLAYRLVNNPQLSDLAFTIEGKTIYAHKAILFSRSEYWAALFASGMSESKLATIELPHNPNYSYDSYLELFRFVYTDSCDINSINVMALIDKARFYGFPRLSALCEQFLSQHIDEDNQFELLKISSEYYLTQLKMLVIGHILGSKPAEHLDDDTISLLYFNKAKNQQFPLPASSPSSADESSPRTASLSV